MGNTGGRKDSKGEKMLPQMFSYTTISRIMGLKKTKTRGGVSDHTGEEGKEAEGKDHWATSNDYSTTTVGC